MRRTRTHYTRDDREQLLAEYRSGGLAPAEFAVARGIRPATFRTWVSRHRSTSLPTRRTAMKFVAVEAGAVSIVGSTSPIEVQIGAVAVRVPSEVGAGFVAELVSRLASSPC